MYNKSNLKIVGGKLISVRCEVKNNKILDIKITGDFFLHPEDSIEDLEKHLNGSNVEHVSGLVNSFFKDDKITVIGADKDDFVKVILDAVT